MIPFLNALTLPGQLPLRLSIVPDAWLVAYAVLLALVTTVACGLAPALRATRVNVSAQLLESGITRATGRLRLRHAFGPGQVALSALLLVLSSLLLRTAARASALDPGFDLDSGVVARIALDSGRSADGRLRIAEQLTDRLQSLPGVRAASVASMIPLGGDVVGRGFDIRGSESHQDLAALVNVVGPRYFEALRIPLTRGREFGRSDRSGCPTGGDRQPGICQTVLHGRGSSRALHTQRPRAVRGSRRRCSRHEVRIAGGSSAAACVLLVRAAAVGSDHPGSFQ